MIKLILKIPYILYQKTKLLNASDAYWERKLKGKTLALDGRQLNPRAQGLFNLQEQLAIPAAKWSKGLMRGGYRKSIELFDGPKAPVKNVEDINIELEGRTLGGRLYNDENLDTAGPCLLYFHGGGFVIGDLETHDGLCRKLALETGQSVLAVDYRLGPESRYPAAMEDALDCWRWLQTNGARHNIDAANMSVAGDSAGAALAILVAAMASKGDLGYLPIAAGLIYPPSPGIETTKSRELLGSEKILLTQELLDWFAGNFMTADARADDTYLGALSNAVSGKMPPSWILTCGFDPLRDDGVHVASKIRELGADVEFQEYEGLYHGFIGASALFPEVDQMVQGMSAFIRKQQAKAIENQAVTAAE